VEAAPLGSGRCAPLRKLARQPARPWRRALAGGFNFGSKLLAAHAAWPDESGYRAWGTEISAANLTIAKSSDWSAGLHARVRASCVCGREIRLTQSRQGAKPERQQSKFATAQRLRTWFVSHVAKLFGPVCGGIFAAASVRACDQIRQSLARQVPLGAAKKANGLVSAHRACLVELSARR